MENLKIIQIENNEIGDEYMCYAISSNTMAQNEEFSDFDLMESQYLLKKYNIHSEAFIEYVPAEKAWLPIDAPSYLLINLFWESENYKEKELGKKLYQECQRHALGMNGIAVVVGRQRQPFLSDKDFFKKEGFELADKAHPFFELWYKPLIHNAPIPQFKSHVKLGRCELFKGISIYYSNAYPITEEYLKTEIQAICKEKGIPLRLQKIESRNQARSHFVPNTIFNVFYDGQLVSHNKLDEDTIDHIVSGKTDN